MKDNSSQSQTMRSDWERARWWTVRTMMGGVVVACGLWLVAGVGVCVQCFAGL